MTHYMLPLLLVGVCDAYIPIRNRSDHDEIHEFQWASGPNLANTTCALPLVPPRRSNTTLEIDFGGDEYSEFFATRNHIS